MDDASAASRNRSASVRRALSLLVALGAEDAPSMGLAELAKTIDADKSTALRLLAPLREFGLVETDDAGRYRVGITALRLGQRYLERLDLRQLALPVLQELTASTGETSHLVLYRHPDVVYIEKVEADTPVRMRSRVGSVESAASTGVGRAYLAHAPQEIVDDLLKRGLEKRTPRTITSTRRWRSELLTTRSRGYAIDDCENEADIRCVAAPILDHRGSPVAALSIAGPASRLTRERAEALGPTVVAAADDVSAKLGGSRRTASA